MPVGHQRYGIRKGSTPINRISDRQRDVARFYDKLKYGLETDDPFIGRYLLGTVGLTERDLAGQSVLEVGIGRGNWTMALAEYSRSYTGADISMDSLRHVKERFTPKVAQSDITALPFPSNHFDRVFGIGVLPAVEKDREGFAELARVLKPGGRLHLFCYGMVWPRNLIRDAVYLLTRNLSEEKKRKVCYRFALLSRLPVPESVLFRNELEFALLDWYLVPIQNRHTYRRIARWMKQEGVSPLRFFPYPHPSRFLFHRVAARMPALGSIISPDFFAEGVKK